MIQPAIPNRESLRILVIVAGQLHDYGPLALLNFSDWMPALTVLRSKFFGNGNEQGLEMTEGGESSCHCSTLLNSGNTALFPEIYSILSVFLLTSARSTPNPSDTRSMTKCQFTLSVNANIAYLIVMRPDARSLTTPLDLEP